MKYIILLTTIFCVLHSFAQISVSEKKGKSTVYSASGKVLMKKLETVELFDTPEYQNMFAVYKNGFCAVYLNNNEHDLISVIQGDFWKAELTRYAENRLVAFDFYNNQYIIESDGIISDTFDYYKNGLRGGTNNLGKVALCTKNSNITEYKYNAIYRLDGSPGEWFVANTDSGNVIIDVAGKQMTHNGMDQIYASAYYDSVFICEKNDLWSVIDLQGRFQLAPTHLLEPYVEFMFDGASFSDLSYTEAIFQKNGKQGVINMFGAEVISPKYDVIQRARAYVYDEWDEPVKQLTTYIVKPDSTVKHWVFIDLELQEAGTIQEDQFIATNDNSGIFLTAGRLQIYDVITGAKTDFMTAGYDERFKLRSSEGVGIADRSGRLIMPFTFYRIDPLFDTEGGMYYCAYTNNGCAIYTEEGRCITTAYNFERISDVCNAEAQYLRVENDKGAGIATIENGEFKMIIPMEFDWISCFSSSPEKPIATAEKKGKEYKLYRDGSVQLKD